MIKANELRKGNLVIERPSVFDTNQSDREIEIYNSWDEGVNLDLYEDERSYIEFGRLKPIPLSEEWLIRFGFEDNIFWRKNTPESYTKKPYIGGRFITKENFLSEKLLEHPFIRFDSIADCYYVHQLQNLYFALTGEELTLKTKK